MRITFSIVAAIATLLLTAMLPASCAQMLAVLPDVIAAVQDGVAIIDAIERFCTLWFAQHPDPPAQAKVNEAIERSRAALDLALHAAQTAKDASDEKLIAALFDFQKAYLDLLNLVKPYGVVEEALPGPLALRAQPGKLIVPHPLAFKFKAGAK